MAGRKMWKCEVCGYIHEGDAPPDECPVCGASADMFTLLDAVVEAASNATRWVCTVCGYIHEGDAPPEECPVCGADASMFEPAPDGPSGGDGESRRIVVVGAGVAGMTAAERAREAAPNASVVVVSREPGLPYYRLNLTRFLAGEVPASELPLHPESWYDEHRIELIAGEVATIDRDTGSVTLTDGTTLPYDRLVLANGAHPFVPPIAGADRDGVFSLRTTQDAEAILSRVETGTRCVCIGGGVLGLETAGALAKHGAQITILEGFPWLLPRQLAEPAGNLLRGHIEGLGMAVRCGVKTRAIRGEPQVTGVELADGEVIPAEVVVLATGIRPNSHLARQCGLEVAGGLLVNDRMETSDPSILAAGDLTEHRGRVYGIWPAAYAQGMVAGVNAAGGSTEFHGIAPSNRLKVLDVDLFSVGEFAVTDGSFEVYEKAEPGAYLRLVCRDGRLIGANLYGDTELATPIRDAIESRAQLHELPAIRGLFPALAALCGD